MKAILPCAGYGLRMGMETNQSKELLIDPTTNKPMLDYHLDLCTLYNLKPLVITRAEKTDLIEYCKNKEVETLIIEAKREWPFTVLNSWTKWDPHNILLLPDTKFSPHSIISDMRNDLYLGAEVSLGLHSVQNPDKWCIVQNYTLFEKPQHFFGFQHAFGLIAFTRNAGFRLFDGLNNDKITKLTNTSFQYLETFKDITRTGIVDGV